MKYNDKEIFSYSATGNSCFETCLLSIDLDNKVFGRSTMDDKSFNQVFKSVCGTFSDDPESSSLAIIGLIDFAVRSQFELTEHHIQAYEKAKNNDPMMDYIDRKTIVSELDAQVLSYLRDQRIYKNDYCN